MKDLFRKYIINTELTIVNVNNSGSQPFPPVPAEPQVSSNTNTTVNPEQIASTSQVRLNETNTNTNTNNNTNTTVNQEQLTSSTTSQESSNENTVVSQEQSASTSQVSSSSSENTVVNPEQLASTSQVSSNENTMVNQLASTSQASSSENTMVNQLASTSTTQGTSNNNILINQELLETMVDYNASQEKLTEVLNSLDEKIDKDPNLQELLTAVNKGNEIVSGKATEIFGLKYFLEDLGLNRVFKSKCIEDLNSKNNELEDMLRDQTNLQSKLMKEINSALESNQSEVVNNSSVNTNTTQDSDSNFSKPDITESSIFNPLSEILETLNDQLDNLSSEELALLTNVLGFCMIFVYVITIILVTFAKSILNYFIFNNRSPK
jgi:hypothetical protein